MPINTTFKAAIQRLAHLAGPDQPAYVSLGAAGRLANLLSPANPRHADIMIALNDDQPHTAPTQASQPPAPPTENPCAVFCTEDDEDNEDDESEGAQQDDEPP